MHVDGSSQFERFGNHVCFAPVIGPLRRSSSFRDGPQAAVSVAAKGKLFDHLVGEGEQRWRDIDAKSLRGLEVEH
jgi:hypothetical protein